MSARDRLNAAADRYQREVCCGVPVVLPNPDCDRHAYVGLIIDLRAALLAPQAPPEKDVEALCARVLRLEVDAMVRVLEWTRVTVVADAQKEASRGWSGLEVMAKLVHRLNRLIRQLEG